MIILICFRVISVCQPANRPATKYWRLSINWCQETYDMPPQKSDLKSGPLSTASSARGIPRGRRLWPGNSVPRRMGNVTRGRRAHGPSPGRGVNREPFLFRADDGVWAPGAHMGLDRSRGVISPPRRRERVLQTDRYVSPTERRFAVKQNYITENKCSGVGKKKKSSALMQNWKG